MWIIQERTFKGVFADIVNCVSTATVDGSEILHQSIPISIPFLIEALWIPSAGWIFVHLHMAPGHLPICMFQPPHLWPIVSSWWQLNYFFCFTTIWENDPIWLIYGCFLKWRDPHFTPQVMIIFSRKTNQWLLGKPTIFFGNPHISNGLVETTKQFLVGPKTRWRPDVMVWSWNDLWPSKEAMKGGLVQDMFLGNVKGCFNTPLEHTPSNLYQKAKEGFLS